MKAKYVDLFSFTYLCTVFLFTFPCSIHNMNPRHAPLYSDVCLHIIPALHSQADTHSMTCSFIFICVFSYSVYYCLCFSSGWNLNSWQTDIFSDIHNFFLSLHSVILSNTFPLTCFHFCICILTFSSVVSYLSILLHFLCTILYLYRCKFSSFYFHSEIYSDSTFVFSVHTVRCDPHSETHVC